MRGTECWTWVSSTTSTTFSIKFRRIIRRPCSATMPQEIVRLSQRYLRNPLPIFIDSDELSVDTVDQKIVQLEEDDQFRALCRFLEQDLISRCLVFCATKIRCDGLTHALHANPYDVQAIHGHL